MSKTKIIAGVFLAALLLSPYFVYANEQPASTESAFVASDKDRSGNISVEEFSDYLHNVEGENVPRVRQDFSMMDLNKDNKLSLSEFSVGEEIYPLAFR